MTLQHHVLSGCRPTPLANYLKALGILRLIGQQLDPACRGWWQDEAFHLLTSKTKHEIEKFFLEQYEPTPLVSPWNKGCGFFKADDPGLAPLEQSTAPRFERFRQGIVASRSLLDQVAAADATIRAIKARTKTNRSFQSEEQRDHLRSSPTVKQTISLINELMNKEGVTDQVRNELQTELETIESILADTDKIPTKTQVNSLKNSDGYKRLLNAADRRFKALKATLIPDCRRQWRGAHAEWLAAAVVLDEDGTPDWPSLLGTGGNDGNLDFTNNFMQRLGDLFDVPSDDGRPSDVAKSLLQDCLWNTATNSYSDSSIGQFQPGAAGGANSSTGTGGEPLVNAWDFVLMLEGSLLLSARSTRRFAPEELSRASAPFAIRAHAAGHASPGTEKAQRGEQWMPLWPRPSRITDVVSLFGESRLQLHRKTASRPIEAARAISRLGAVRGVNSFVRYGYLERNGQSTLAVPLGRIAVQHHPLAALIDDLSQWLDRIQMRARDSYAPARLVHCERRLANAVMSALTKDTPLNPNPHRWQAVLEAAVDVEAIQAAGTAVEAGPIPLLRPEWIGAIDDGSPEVRLAIALGSAARVYAKSSRPIDPIRRHWLPLTSGWYPKFNVSDNRLADDPRVVIHGRDFSADCAAIVARRVVEAQQSGVRRLPLVAAKGCGATLKDVSAFISGQVNDQKLSRLSRAMMAVRWDKVDQQHLPNKRAKDDDAMPEEAWLMIRLAHLPYPLPDDRSIPVEPAIVRLLQSGDATRAIEIAARRLRSSGIRPPIQTGFADPTTAQRWAAALAFPLNYGSIRLAAEIVDPATKGTTHA